MSDKGDSYEKVNGLLTPRFILAAFVVSASIVGVAALAGVIIGRDSEFETAKYVLGVTLPLIGTWVGTVLAFYFSRENFESASRNAREMVKQMTQMEKLASIPVNLKMIRRAQMTCLNMTPDKPLDDIRLVGDIVETMKAKGRNRLPILDENDHPKYMIHRSMIDKYLAKKSIEGGLPADELKDLSLTDLLEEDKELRDMFETSFATTREDATLADAKIAMDKVKDCLDVFVTENGAKNEPVLGWLTNLIITESAKV